MYQIISSAIVNRPPPNLVIRAAHLFSTKWYPITNTEEEIIDFFEQAPEFGAKLFIRKLLPNRNWCYFEQCESMDRTPVDSITQDNFLDKYFWPIIDFLLLLLGLSLILNWKHKKKKPLIVISRNQSRSSSLSNSNNQSIQEINHLKVQFWLENSIKKERCNPIFKL